MIIKEIRNLLAAMENKGAYPDVHTIDFAPTLPEIIFNGKKVLVFCSNNYLGLATDERLKVSAKLPNYDESSQSVGLSNRGFDKIILKI